MFHCLFHRCELSKWSNIYQKYGQPMLAVAKLYKTRPHCSPWVPHCRCISIRADALSCRFPRSPMPIPSHPKQWHNCSGCVFLSCWVAGSVLKSWRHVSWQSTASAECGRMRSPQVLPCSVHSPELWGDVWTFKHQLKRRCLPKTKKKTNSPKHSINQQFWRNVMSFFHVNIIVRHGTKAPYSNSFVTKSKRSFATASLMATCPCSSALFGLAFPDAGGDRWQGYSKKIVAQCHSFWKNDLTGGSWRIFEVQTVQPRQITIHKPPKSLPWYLISIDIPYLWVAVLQHQHGHSSQPSEVVVSWSSLLPEDWHPCPTATWGLSRRGCTAR